MRGKPACAFDADPRSRTGAARRACRAAPGRGWAHADRGRGRPARGAILSATSDLADCARGSCPVLSGSLRLGVIPTLAPYVLPRVLPELHRQHPKLRLDLLETQTKTLVAELGHGALDVILLALPIDKAGLETLPLFEDRFLLAVPG